MLEFLGLPGVGKLLEADLERGLLDNLQVFFYWSWAGLCVHSQTISNKLGIHGLFHGSVFFNYLLKCFVLFDLKSGELIHQDIGQMDMYVRMVDDLKRASDDNPTVGIILYAQKDASVVRYSVLNESEQIFASRYKLVLPSEEELRAELETERDALSSQFSSKPPTVR
jgi:YhcG PDDEXK nuclease domain